uniref:Uncharacterized protein n=1 Tax=Glossina austeni TaxID=7395 RepID=A0A1A9UYK3_GLOAU
MKITVTMISNQHRHHNNMPSTRLGNINNNIIIFGQKVLSQQTYYKDLLADKYLHTWQSLKRSLLAVCFLMTQKSLLAQAHFLIALIVIKNSSQFIAFTRYLCTNGFTNQILFTHFLSISKNKSYLASMTSSCNTCWCSTQISLTRSIPAGSCKLADYVTAITIKCFSLLLGSEEKHVLQVVFTDTICISGKVTATAALATAAAAAAAAAKDA